VGFRLCSMRILGGEKLLVKGQLNPDSILSVK
jgi:hypothetical protein